MAKKVKMPGRIESASPDGIVTGAAEIFDDGKEKMQSVINTEVSAELLRLENEKQNNLSFDNAPTENSNNPITSGAVYTAEKALSDAIEAILILIPSAATALNQLADKSFVESALSTATATFRGTYNVVSDLGLAYNATHEQIAAKLGQVISTADNNDYCFVQVSESATSTDINHTERYKFNGSVWAYEYDLNNSGFTADQWAAINSNITAVLVAKLAQLPTADVLATLLAGKQDNLTFDNRPTAGSDNPVKSGGVYASENEIIALINALEVAKQDKLTFDSTPTNGSSNPVTSGGVYEAIYLVQVALASLDNRVLSAEHSISVLTENVGILRSLYQALTLSDIIVGSLPTTGVANTVYRVPGVSTYADWMYYNGAWVKLAEYTTLDGYLYKGIATPSGSPAASAVKMFYFALTAGTYTNFGNIEVKYGINILKYDGANWTLENLGDSDGVFDATEYSGSSFASLEALLTDANLNNIIPIAVRKGGMSIKFVSSVDNKYIQTRCMAQNFTTDVTQWQGVDAKPTPGSKNFVESGGVYNEIESLEKQIIGYSNDNVTFNRYISTLGKWASSTTNKYRITLIKIEPEDVLTIQTKNTHTYYFILKENDLTLGTTPKYATGYSYIVTVESGTSSGNIVVPSDGHYLVIFAWYNNTYIYPYSITVNGIELLDIQNEFKKQQEQIDAVASQIGTTESLVTGLQTQCGDKKFNEIPITPSWNNGGITGSTVGSTIGLSASTGYRYIVKTCVGGDVFKCHIYQSTSTSYNHYICFTDADDKVLAAYAPLKQTADYYDYIVEAPANTAKVYVTTYYSSTILPNVTIKTLVIVSIQDQINELASKELSPLVRSSAYQDELTEETFNLWKINRLDDMYKTSEAVGYNAFATVVSARTGIKFAICSDIHFGGRYATTPTDSNRRTSERCFGIFDKVVNNLTNLGGICCGDISTDYGLDKTKLLNYMNAVINRFGFIYGNFYITKGNHDVNESTYVEVPFEEVDFASNTYYINTGLSTFTSVAEGNWRGEKLYKYQQQLVTDKEFIKWVQRYKGPTDAVWGNGAYYYKDIPSQTLRIINLNSFPVNDNGDYDYGTMFKWFAEEALDLSTKDVPSDWHILIMQHLSLNDTLSANRTAFVNIINAFKTGGTVSGTLGGVTYSKDYSGQGNGIIIALIHGHNHAYYYDNSNGINDMGMTWMNYYAKPTSQHPNEWGDSTKYGISVITIDKTNRIIYDDHIDGTSRNYSY